HFARRRLGQVDGDASRHHGRGDHEHDEQHQHHVDERGDVDLAHHLVALAATAASAAPAPCYTHAHYLRLRASSWRPRMAENSSAKPSSLPMSLLASPESLL